LLNLNIDQFKGLRKLLVWVSVCILFAYLIVSWSLKRRRG
jgi:hypothetical protein